MANQILDRKKPSSPIWEDWDQFLQRWDLKGTAADLIAASEPMHIIMAQILHFGSPLLRLAWPGGHWESLAEMLEDRQQSKEFASFLRNKGKV